MEKMEKKIKLQNEAKAIARRLSSKGQLSEISNAENKVAEANPVPRDVSIPEIMTYYTPKWLAWAGLLCSALTGGVTPLFGFFAGKLLFTFPLFPRPDFYT